MIIFCTWLVKLLLGLHGALHCFTSSLKCMFMQSSGDMLSQRRLHAAGEYSKSRPKDLDCYLFEIAIFAFIPCTISYKYPVFVCCNRGKMYAHKLGFGKLFFISRNSLQVESTVYRTTNNLQNSITEYTRM